MNKKLFKIVATAIMFIIISSQWTFAVYRWTDESGNIHISETPNPNNPSNSEFIPENTSKPNSNRPAKAMQTQPYSFPAPPPQIYSPAGMQMPNSAPNPQPLRINPTPFDQKAAERAVDQALEPLTRLMAWIVLIGILHMLLFILTLVNIMKSEFTNNINKILWVLIVLVMPVLGALLYFFIGRQQRVNQGETSYRWTKYRDIGRE